MSAPTNSSGANIPGWKKKVVSGIKAVVTLVVLLVLAIAAWSAYTNTLPSFWRESRTVRNTFDSAHKANNARMKKVAKVQSDEEGDVDPEATGASIDKQVDISVRLDDEEAIRRAKLEHRIPATAIPVSFRESTWHDIGIIPGPTYIMVGLRDAEGHEDLNPQGDFTEGKPEKFANNKTVMEDLDPHRPWVPYRAPLAAVCKNGSCTVAPLHTNTLVCPGDRDNAGKLEVRTNENVVVFNQRTESAYTYAPYAAYHVWFDNKQNTKEDAKTACQKRAAQHSADD